MGVNGVFVCASTCVCVLMCVVCACAYEVCGMYGYVCVRCVVCMGICVCTSV